MTPTNLIIRQGKTFTRTLRWGATPYLYKAITGITKAAPAVITSAGHAIPDGWRAAIVSAKGMTQINALNSPPRSSEYHKITAIDTNSVSANDINSAGYTAYASGGYLQMLTPVDLAGYTARMSVKDAEGGTEFLRLDTSNSRITLDNTAKTITLLADATVTAAITDLYGVYDLELVSATGVVTVLLSGAVTVIPEVTTT